jgi:GT2 family glycosyltransferase
MDLDYYLRLMRLGYHFAYFPEALASFRWHDDSTTLKNLNRMHAEALRCKQMHIDQRNLPLFLKNATILKGIRKIFQVRRVMKRIITHGDVR